MGDVTVTSGTALERVVMKNLFKETCSRRSQIPEDVGEEHSR